MPSSLRAAIGRGEWVGVLTRRQRLPAPFLAPWVAVELPVGDRRWRVFLPPGDL
ncbi:hypothetical protein [Thermocatellispora tengchongensis]|uniref:hypothetical protein n=1 Tax=Thermocatellispora tengchongensis TaxID=1073253 RepID=UPI003642CCC1